MGAHESEAMRIARDLVVKNGITPYAAAKAAGISASAIYMAAWYKQWKGSKK